MLTFANISTKHKVQLRKKSLVLQVFGHKSWSWTNGNFGLKMALNKKCQYDYREDKTRDIDAKKSSKWRSGILDT